MGIRERVCGWLVRRAQRRAPDFVIGGRADPYLRRWWMLPRNPFLNIYVHEIRRADDDRALHDHPWPWASFVVSGAYCELTDERQGDRSVYDWIQRKWRTVWGTNSFRWNWPRFAHRLEPMGGPVWTVFITGPKIRAWGFLCPQGWLHWKRFTAPGDTGQIGKGCDG